jgi:hypothetical protein
VPGLPLQWQPSQGIPPLTIDLLHLFRQVLDD